MYFLKIMVLILLTSDNVNSDLAKDRELCADQLIELAACFPYVSGDDNSPTLECCTGLKTLLFKGKICLCLLIKDRDDPQLGLKINASLALNLPFSCHVHVNVSQCPGLLYLALNSTEAKIFYDDGGKRSRNGSSKDDTLISSSSSVADEEATSDGRSGKKIGNLVFMKMVLVWCYAAHILLIIII